LPKDEAYLYEDALSHGRSIVFVLPESEDEAKAARQILDAAGAESLDAAREAWWIGIRDAEKTQYEGAGGRFEEAEAVYRRGFVAALHPEHRGTPYAACKVVLFERHGSAAESEAFRRGYDRGLRHAGTFAARRSVEPGRSAGGSKPSRPAET
jgi:hypothetical protein